MSTFILKKQTTVHFVLYENVVSQENVCAVLTDCTKSTPQIQEKLDGVNGVSLTYTKPEVFPQPLSDKRDFRSLDEAKSFLSTLVTFTEETNEVLG